MSRLTRYRLLPGHREVGRPGMVFAMLRAGEMADGRDVHTSDAYTELTHPSHRPIAAVGTARARRVDRFVDGTGSPVLGSCAGPNDGLGWGHCMWGVVCWYTMIILPRRQSSRDRSSVASAETAARPLSRRRRECSTLPLLEHETECQSLVYLAESPC
jgi:hypothetical protein